MTRVPRTPNARDVRGTYAVKIGLKPKHIDLSRRKATDESYARLECKLTDIKHRNEVV
jgi:hypothetical protein